MNAIDSLFGGSAAALSIRAHRFELISANLANADTPGYKAVDIDFGEALAAARAEGPQPHRSNPRHIAMDAGTAAPELKYRLPAQLTLDGNSVETEQEHAAFMDNAIRYQASLNFLNGRIKSILLALRGE